MMSSCHKSIVYLSMRLRLPPSSADHLREDPNRGPAVPKPRVRVRNNMASNDGMRMRRRLSRTVAKPFVDSHRPDRGNARNEERIPKNERPRRAAARARTTTAPCLKKSRNLFRIILTIPPNRVEIPFPSVFRSIISALKRYGDKRTSPHSH